MPSIEEYIEQCMASPECSFGPTLREQIRDLIGQNAGYLAPSQGPSLVHGDYKLENILVSRAGDAWQVTGVLDWEFAFAGDGLFDLAPLLRFSDFMPVEFEQGIIAGLRAAGEAIPNDWKRRVRLLDFASLCDFACRGASQPQLAADARRLVEATLRDWQNL
jgi:aminoglycoside phosphotransferase (APT) family kinase protein